MNELHSALERLRAELEQTDFRDAAARQHLQELIDDIERQAGTGRLAGERQALLARLRDSIRRFEVEHPNLTGCLGQMMTSLSNMGI